MSSYQKRTEASSRSWHSASDERLGQRRITKHFFHCTDGRDFVLDATGEEVEIFELDLGAEAAAAHVARGFPASFDWSGWFVAVYDGLGQQVAVIPFPRASH
jgi:hypothetical protein